MRALQHLDRGRGILQRHVGGAEIAGGIGRHDRADAVVLQLGESFAQIGRHRIAGKIDVARKHLHIDALAVHRGDALVGRGERQIHRPDIAAAGEPDHALLVVAAELDAVTGAVALHRAPHLGRHDMGMAVDDGSCLHGRTPGVSIASPRARCIRKSSSATYSGAPNS